MFLCKFVKKNTVINITENSFLKNPEKAISRLWKEHEILKVVSDEKSYVIIDSEEWDSIFETIYLNNIKGYPESIINAAKEDLQEAVKLNELNW